MRITMTTRALINNQMKITRMSCNTLPIVLLVHHAAVGLLVEIIEIIFKLSVSNPCTEECDWSELQQAGFPAIVMILLVYGGPSAVRRARRTHENDQDAVLLAIMPKRRLLLGPREVGAAHDVEVGPTTCRTSPHKHMCRAPKAAADLAHVVARRQTIGQVDELGDVPGTPRVAASKQDVTDQIRAGVQTRAVHVVVLIPAAPKGTD